MLAQLECPRGQTQALHRQGVWRQRLECPRGQTQALHRQRLVLVLLALVLYRHRLVLVLRRGLHLAGITIWHVAC